MKLAAYFLQAKKALVNLKMSHMKIVRMNHEEMKGEWGKVWEVRRYRTF